MNTIQPLRPQFKLSEDEGFIKDQILERVQSESCYEWAKNSTSSLQDKLKRDEQTGKNYLLSRSSVSKIF